MAVLMSKQMVIPSTLPPIGTPLNDCTWEQISEISNLGLASTYFNVGDTKTIIINGKVGATTFTNLSIDAFIIGINHNADIEGDGITFQIGRISGVNVALCDSNYNIKVSTNGAFTMYTSTTNSGGWASSHMRKTVLGSDSDPLNPTTNTLLSALPAELRSVMKPITKYTDNKGGGTNTVSNVTVTEDHLFLLSEFEAFGTRTYANSTEQNYQKQYDYYKAGNSRQSFKHSATGTSVWWFLRSPVYSSAKTFCGVYTNTTGRITESASEASGGVRPIFVV